MSVLLVAGCVFDPVDDETPIELKEAPSNPSPRNNSINIQTSANLSWSANNLETYDVYFDINNPPDSVLASDTNVTVLSVSGLKLDTRYYWRVIGKYANGTESWGPVWNFKTKPVATSLDGYVMLKHDITTETPSYVNILFQVLDLNGTGITDLTENDFYILENDIMLSELESAVRVRKKEQIDYTLKTILFLDNSSSLSTDLPELKNAAIAFVNNMDANQKVALYKFSDGSALLQDFTSNKNLLISAINSIDLGFNSTDLYGAVIDAADEWSEKFTLEEIEQTSIVLFTDGTDTQGKHSLESALGSISGKRFYTIGLGQEVDTVVLGMLGNSGFYKADSIDELTDTFLEIQFNLEKYANSFYLLNYLSPKRGDNIVTVKLMIENNVYTGNNSYVYGQFNSRTFYSVSPGVFINSTTENPEGISSLDITQGETVSVQAESYLVEEDPYYLWNTSNNKIVTVAPSSSDNSIAYITAVGSVGETATVVITDFNNDMQKIITINIR